MLRLRAAPASRPDSVGGGGGGRALKSRWTLLLVPRARARAQRSICCVGHTRRGAGAGGGGVGDRPGHPIRNPGPLFVRPVKTVAVSLDWSVSTCSVIASSGCRPLKRGVLSAICGV